MIHQPLLCAMLTFILLLSFQSQIHAQGTQFGKSLRQERIDQHVCEDEQSEDFDEEWDLCFKPNFVPTTTLAPRFKPNLPFKVTTDSSPKQFHCLCDDECVNYNDCCSDLISGVVRSGTANQLSCVNLYSNSLAHSSVYGIDQCDDQWIESDGSVGVRDKCEHDSYDLKSVGKNVSYLQDIAVFSQSSKTMYRNIFCAICNNDFSNLIQWNMSVKCGGMKVNDLLKDRKNNMRPENYDPNTKSWKVLIDNQQIDCSIVVQQFQGPEFISENKLRKCKKTISKCPLDWKNVSVSEKCESYASYVYENSIKGYKNFHCAICNGANLRSLTCFPQTNITDEPGVRGVPWFPLLLDFNFAADKGRWVGGDAKCPDIGQIYDPMYQKCIFLHCAANYHTDDQTGRCIPIEDPSNRITSESNCSAFTILNEREDFVLLPNKSIYINQTKTILSQNDYQVYNQTEETSLKVKICINESSLDISSLTQSPFDVSFGQILLSQISLYTSIVCLTLHLIVYAILPKLRNLPGKNLVSLSSSLLVAHISFIISSALEADRRIGCVLIAICTHYSYMASFCWMSVMANDVCKTFSRTSRRTSSRRYTFLKYSLYAWLLPAVIVIISAAFDIGLKGSSFQPLYGFRFCWISQRQALLVFFAAPVAIIVVTNIILFSLTAKGLVTHAEQTKILNKNSDKVRYFLYIKLAFVMGLTWIFGFIASLTNMSFLWYPFIILNGLQGAIIFFAFTCKRKVWNLLMEKFGFKAAFIRPSKSATTSDIIRSATGSTSLQTSTLIPCSPNTNVTKIKFPK